jgi:hypothetical protein
MRSTTPSLTAWSNPQGSANWLRVRIRESTFATNLVLQSQTFDNASWTKSETTISANAVAAPDSTTTADKLVESATANFHFAYQDISGLSDNTNYTFSVFAKAAERTKLTIEARTKAGVFPNARFDLSGGTVFQTNTAVGYVSSAITWAGNGWWRCSLTVNIGSGGSTPRLELLLNDAASAHNYTGNGVSGLYLWGAQSETGYEPTDYKATTTASVSALIWRDLSNLSGYNWIRSADWGYAVDDQVATANVELWRECGPNLSLAPLRSDSKLNNLNGSYSPLIDAGREVKIETATLAMGVKPGYADWQCVFHGVIDKPDAGSEVMSLECRDLGARLQDAFIETEAEYGDDATPVDVRTVMQDLIDSGVAPNTWAAATAYVKGAIVRPTVYNNFYYVQTAASGTSHAVTQPTWPTSEGLTVSDNGLTWRCHAIPQLYTPVDPGWALKLYKQQKEPVLSALETIAAQIGWTVRYEWRTSTNQFELTFATPDREKEDPDLSVPQAKVIEVTELAIDKSAIRNYWAVTYSDKADLDPKGEPKRKTVYSTGNGAGDLSSDSIVAHGRRYAEITEASSSNIDTSTEAQAMADAAAPYLWGTQLGDMLELVLPTHASISQELAVTSVRHSFSAPDDTGQSEERTEVELRGKPAGYSGKWLERVAHPGVAPSVEILSPSALTPTVTATTLGVVVVFVPSPRTVETELHLSTSSSFPISSSTLRDCSAATHFLIGNLTPGTTYYGKLVARDAYGNRSVASTEFSFVAKYSSVGTGLYPYLNYGRKPINGEFEFPPDTSIPGGWTIVTGTWDTNIQRVDGEAQYGSRTLYFMNVDAAVRVESELFPIDPNATPELRWAQRYTDPTWGGGGPPAYAKLTVKVLWYDNTRAYLSGSDDSIDWAAFTSNAYDNPSWTSITIPSGAAWAKVAFVKASGNAFAVHIDDVRYVET